VLAVQVKTTECAVPGAAVKLIPVWFVPLKVTFLFVGVNAKPDAVGVTLYVPLGNPVNV
jgi:hypothetical protein